MIRRAWMKLGLPLGVLVLALGCSLLIGDFNECADDADCAARGDGLACIDSMCVSDPDPLRKACGTLIGDTEAADDEVFTFGAVMAMSFEDGNENPRGQYRSRAIDLALSEANQVGVAGRPFRVRICDHQGDGERVKELTRYLIEEYGVLAVLTGSSSNTLDAASVTTPAAVLLMAISASSPAITTLPDDGLVWRIASSDAIVGEFVAQQVAVDPGASTKVGILAVNDSFGTGLSSVFRDSHNLAGGESRIFTFEPDGSDLSTVLTNTNGYQPDLLFVIAFAENGAVIVNALPSHNNLPQGAGLFFADSIKDSTFLGAVTDTGLLENARGASPGVPEGVVYDGFAQRFNDKYSLDPADQGYLAHSYDAAYCLALATAYAVGAAPDGAAGVTGANLAEGLRHLSSGDSYELEPVDFAPAAAALQGGADIDIHGASGALDFDPVAGEAPSSSVLWWIYGGAFQSDPPTGTDAGTPADAGTGSDAATGMDAGVSEDAAVEDAAVEDAA